ncbi:MAG: tyrosine--tRNA ligase [Propionibacteriaceae bacterium]|jgi:tyrosyl-tRNA synthetase|nr:tyrosine--tRNA ligase [Propionibacteriaceae bacterium]
MSLFEEFSWRGLIAHSTDPQALAAALDGELTFYVGFDPSAPSLHMGNLLQLITAQRLQRAGHRPILLVGGSTGLIGDPRQTSERKLNPADVVQGWVEKIRSMVSRFVSFEGDNAALVVNNYDWTVDLTILDFLRDIGKYFSLNRMLDREVVKSRLESGISFTEFSYVLLQSMDYLELHRRFGASLQTGGSDQWGNITAGVELIRKVTGDHVHALSTPLITKADGTKYGKTESGAVWLDPTMTSPYAFHQFFLNVEDATVGNFLRMFTNRSREEIAELETLTKTDPGRRAAQRVVADDLTDLVHSPAERHQATQAAGALFGQGDLSALDADTLLAASAELPTATWSQLADQTILDALVDSGVVASRGAAKRTVLEGGAYLNNQRISQADYRLAADDVLPGGLIILRRGKKTIGAVRLTTTQ